MCIFEIGEDSASLDYIVLKDAIKKMYEEVDRRREEYLNTYAGSYNMDRAILEHDMPSYKTLLDGELKRRDITSWDLSSSDIPLSTSTLLLG